MELSHTYAGLAGFGYAVAAIFSKRALQAGCGILRLSFVINLVFVLVFSVLLFRESPVYPWSQIHLPILTGCLFFMGQVLTFAAIRMGDVSLQTPVMGTKAVFVVLIALALGSERITPQLGLAAVLSMLAIALLGFSGAGAERVGLTFSLALLSALFFAGSDVMVGLHGAAFGTGNFLFTAILINGLLSFVLIPFFREPLASISSEVWPWAILAAFLMALQALLLNYTLAHFQNVAAINVLYSSRGLWSVLLAVPMAYLFSLPRENRSRRIVIQRAVGACLLCAAIAIVFS